MTSTTDFPSTEAWRTSLIKSASDSTFQLPAIPGIKTNRTFPKCIPQNMKVIHGVRRIDGFKVAPPASMLPEDLDMFKNTGGCKEAGGYSDLTGRYSIHKQNLDRLNKAPNLPFSKQPKFLSLDRKVLRFNAYYVEPVYESPQEKERVRKCDIYCYLSDGSIQIVEHKQPNSGIPQGDFLKRHLVSKPGTSEFYTEKDLRIGAELPIYGKIIKIVDCDKYTKDHLSNTMGETDFTPIPYPDDRYTAILTSKLQKETGADPNIKRNRKMHPMKKYMEANLGKPMKMQDLGSFLENDRKVLRFFCIWDDTSKLYGDILQFVLHYYLVDDTMEILQKHIKNSGRDSFPKMLARSRVPKDGSYDVPQSSDEPSTDDGCYSWSDLGIGSEIMLFGRKILICDADNFTRDFYAKNNKELGPCIEMAEEEVPELKFIIPPHNGIGTEEDSLQNCLQIREKAPQRNTAKMAANSGKILRFGAKILTDNKDDKLRYFVIMFYLEDNTIAIREPPLRNSGFVGGTFLRRNKIHKSIEDYYEATDFYVGAFVNLNGHSFELTEADSYTLGYMESKCYNGWPDSDWESILVNLSKYQESMRLAIMKKDNGTGFLSYEDLLGAVKSTGIALSKQAGITLCRSLDPKERKRIPITRILKRLENPKMAIFKSKKK